MTAFDPEELARWTGGEWMGGRRPARLAGFSHDTRLIGSDHMFVALSDRRDGHDFVAEAMTRGASAALVAREVSTPLPQLKVSNPLAALHAVARAHRGTFPGKVVGITGSCGKTSTKDMLTCLLGERAVGTLGNFNNTLGVPLSLLRLDAEKHRHAIIEAGINLPGEMETLAGMIRPDIALVTLVAPAHLEGLGTVEAVAREKALLAHAAASAGGEVVLADSCRAFTAFRDFAGSAWWLRNQSEASASTPHAREVRYAVVTSGGGREALLHVWQEGYPELSLPVPRLGPGMTANMALAVVTARILGVETAQLAGRMRNWVPSHFRGELYRDGKKLYFVDCYNANPASMLEAMATFSALAGKDLPRLWVLGGMKELGAGSRRYHHETVASLPWRAGDRFLAVGAESAWLAEGFREKYPQGAVECLLDPMEALDSVRSFEGAVFLKGSRAYALENLLPVTARKEALSPC